MKILITGATGMVGRHLVQALNKKGGVVLLTPTRNELDLFNKNNVETYVKNSNCDLIVHLAARVGGIQANINAPVEFLVENTLINTHLIQAALQAGVKQFINLASSCMYPRDRELLSEEDLLSGKLEPTNEGYAISKIASTLLCSYIQRQYGLAYKTLVPCNLYGPYDHFDLNKSHLIPAVIEKLHVAKAHGRPNVEIWGDGTARREFMYVEDLIRFILLAIEKLDTLPDYLNIGLGHDYSINEYYQTAADIIGFTGKFTHDFTKPVGMRRKLLNINKAVEFGWKPSVSLAEGIEKTYHYYLSIRS